MLNYTSQPNTFTTYLMWC